ncbi:MAG: hypothetical protein KDB63_17880 [Nocardioidaceae bacterium]|nr:hypothetical protein [Nocardioidaceae bacterium]
MSQDLKALLEDAVAFAPEERHSVPAIVAAARRDRTRRTRIVVSLAVAAMVVIAGVGVGILASRGTGREPAPVHKVVRVSEARPAVEGEDFVSDWSRDISTRGPMPLGIVDSGELRVAAHDDASRSGLLDPQTGRVRWLEPPPRGTYLFDASPRWNIYQTLDLEELEPNFDVQATTTGEWSRIHLPRSTWPELADQPDQVRFGGAWLRGDLIYLQFMTTTQSALMTVDLRTHETTRIDDGGAWSVAVGADAIAWAPLDRPGTVVVQPLDGGAATTLAVDLGQGCRIAELAVTATRVGVRQLCDEESGPVEVYGLDGARQVSVVDSEDVWLALTADSLLLVQPDADGGGRLLSYAFDGGAWTWLPTGRNPVPLGVAGRAALIAWTGSPTSDDLSSRHFAVLEFG